MKIIDWRPIKGFDGYFINELGEVKSTRSFKGTQERILKSSKNQQSYITYNLMRSGKVFRKPLHRLLMETFKPNKDNLPCINHIDGNILNNSLDNLEWCTYGHNEKEAYRLGLKKPAWKDKTDIQHPNSKKVNQYDLDGNLIKKWNCISTIEKELGISITSICNCCSGRSKKAGNFIWRYENE
jgi:hypothetical protein